MAEVDTSSYKMPTQPSFLDTAGKYQALESNKIGIDQSKLKLVNDQFKLMNEELSTLANDPSVTKEVAAKRLNTFADTMKMPAEVRQHMLGELQAAPNVQTFAKTAIVRGADNLGKINLLHGVPGN